MDVNLFLSASESKSSEDSQCDQEGILEEKMLDDTVIEDTQVEVDSEKNDIHLILKVFAFMLLALFKVFDGALFALL